MNIAQIIYYLALLGIPNVVVRDRDFFRDVSNRAVFVRFPLGCQSFDWRLATIAGMGVAKLVPWNSLLN